MVPLAQAVSVARSANSSVIYARAVLRSVLLPLPFQFILPVLRQATHPAELFGLLDNATLDIGPLMVASCSAKTGYGRLDIGPREDRKAAAIATEGRGR